MSRQISALARQSAYAQETGEVWAFLLTINHPNFTEPIRLANDPKEILPNAGVRGIVSRGEEYVFMPFTATLASQDDGQITKAQLVLDNIDRTIVSAVRSANSSLAVTLEVVLSSQPDIVEVSNPDFRINRVTYDALTVTGELSMEYLDLEPYPSKRMTPSYFPGLF